MKEPALAAGYNYIAVDILGDRTASKTTQDPASKTEQGRATHK